MRALVTLMIVFYIPLIFMIALGMTRCSRECEHQVQVTHFTPDKPEGEIEWECSK